MKFILHVRNPFLAMRRIARRLVVLSALGAFLLIVTAGSAAQKNANMSAVLPPASPQPLRAATDTQRKLAAAAVAESVQIEWNTGLGAPFSIRGKDLGARRTFSAGKGLQAAKSARPEANAIAVLDNLSGIMGIREAQNEFAAQPAQGDPLGFQHVRADQTYQGLKVFGGNVIVHFNQEGAAYQVNGRYVPDIAVNATPALAPAEALTLAAEDLEGIGKSNATPLREPELVVFAYKTAPRLAYALSLTADPREANAWQYWIDAQDGTVLMRYNDVKMATITGAILTGEGGAIKTVTDCYADDVTNYLWSTNWPWLVYNISTNGALYPDAANLAFRTTNNWGTSDRTEMSAAYNFDLIQKYYRIVQGRQSYDNYNDTILAYVHYENSYWVNNASWQGGGLVLIGEGDGTIASGMAVLDVCGHEFTHGVTEYSADLIYAYEPGALNESFSDIFGASTEFYGQPDGRTNYPGKVAGTADWLMGEDCWLYSTALRDMRNPANTATVGSGGEQPNHYKGPYWYSGSGDNGGVHYNSGVQNYFFYLLSEGGTNVYNGTTTIVAGIGVTNASLVAYRALTVYCYKFTDYAEIRAAWISAAQDLNPAWVASVIQAWEAVGYGNNTLADLGTALNATYLAWYTGGNQNWFAESGTTHDGALAAQSGLISDAQQSRLQTTVTGPGTISFWWKVSSEANYDYLRFLIDGQEQAKISGEAGWAWQAFDLVSGTHIITWNYTKDFSVSTGRDAGWVDQAAWAPVWTPTVPAITATKYYYYDRIRITWPAVSGATDYLLYRHTVNNSAQAQLIATLTSPIYDDTAVVPGTVYYYWMKARNCATVTPFSGMDTGSCNLQAPTALAASKGDYTGSVRLTWAAATGATGYRIMRNTIADPNTAVPIIETGATGYDDTTAMPGVNYYYWLASRKWRPEGILTSLFSASVSGWRRSMAATDNAFCDFDGDGKADPAVYQQASGYWKVAMSGNRYKTTAFKLGGAGYLPVPQDFDGDGKTDIAVYSQAAGRWMFLLSGSGYSAVTACLGGPGSIALPRDFDGDGYADPAVFYQSSSLWKILFSSQRYALVQGDFGNSAYSPCPADFDNDGKTDPAVFQVRQMIMGKLGYWLAILSASAYAPHDWSSSKSGQTVPQDYDGDRMADAALYDAAAGLWRYWPSSIISSMPYSLTIGGAGYVPVAGDYDGDKKADAGVYQESTGTWVVRLSGNRFAPVTFGYGEYGDKAAAVLPYGF